MSNFAEIVEREDIDRESWGTIGERWFTEERGEFLRKIGNYFKKGGDYWLRGDKLRIKEIHYLEK